MDTGLENRGTGNSKARKLTTGDRRSSKCSKIARDSFKGTLRAIGDRSFDGSELIAEN